MEELNIGNDSVAYGNVGKANIGNRSVVIGPTDAFGNIIINQGVSTAIGYGAKAGLNSIAIGAYAGAGTNSDVFSSLALLQSLITKSDPNNIAIKEIIELSRELKGNQDSTKIINLWNSIKGHNWEKTIQIANLILSIGQLYFSAKS